MKQKREETLLSSNSSSMLSAESVSNSAGLSRALIPDTDAITSTPPFTNVPTGSTQGEEHTLTVISNAMASTSSHTLPLTATDSSASPLCSVSSYGSDLIWSSWPPMLPEQPLLLHLYVHRFFVSSSNHCI